MSFPVGYLMFPATVVHGIASLATEEVGRLTALVAGRAVWSRRDRHAEDCATGLTNNKAGSAERCTRRGHGVDGA